MVLYEYVVVFTLIFFSASFSPLSSLWFYIQWNQYRGILAGQRGIQHRREAQALKRATESPHKDFVATIIRICVGITSQDILSKVFI